MRRDETARAEAARRRGANRTAAMAGMVLALAGCRAPAPPAVDRHLLELFEPALAAGAAGSLTVEVDGEERTLPSAAPHRVRVARSERQALLTGAGVRWAIAADALDGAALAFSVAVLGTDDGEAIVERVTGEGREELYRAVLSPGAWNRRRVPLSTRPGDRLELRSQGPSPVAWAEIHELRGTAGRARAAADRPDLVLISIDTVRADHLSAYGYARPTSPRLERLAAESLLFSRSFSASTWTLPSTATLLTGLLPAQHGLRAVHHRLVDSVDTLAERLQREGYRTAAITDGGFVGFGWGFSQGFERFDATAGEAWAPKDVAKIAAAAARFLEENRFRPFFLFVHTYETHKPYVNTEGFADPFLDPAYDGPFRRAAQFDPFDVEGLRAADRRRIVDFYDGEVRRADHYLGQLLDRLRAGGRWQDTAVLVTSDHGEEFLDHGHFDHGFGQVYDPNVRVPLILKLPGRDRPGRGGAVGAVVEHPVSGLDVAPTLLELAGVPATGLPGRSLRAAAGAPATTAARGDDPRVTFVHGTNSFPKIHEERFRLDLGSMAVVFDKIRGTAEWYDLGRDPEMRSPGGDVFGGPAAPAARRLQSILAWSANAELMAALPEGARRLLVPPTSKLAPLGAWSGLSWRKARPASGGGWRVELEAGRPQILVFSPRRGKDGWILSLERRGSESREELRLRPERTGEVWNPLVRPLSGPGRILPSAALFQPGTTELSAEDVEELKALGYL